MKRLKYILMIQALLWPVIIFSQDGVGHNPESSNLTDEERIIEEEFVHQGKAQRDLKEACEGLDDACDGEAATALGSEVKDQLVMAVAKAYTAVMGIQGSDIKMREKTPEAALEGETASETGAATTDDKKTMKDNCKYIAVGTEVLSTVHQTTAQKDIQSVPVNEDTAQKEYLYQVARGHKVRTKTATIQTIGWGSTTVCYGWMMSQGADYKSAGIRMAASGILTLFFNKQRTANKEYEKKVLEIANKLPSKGDCNPISERNCYCSQPETQNDQQYCMPGIYSRHRQANQERISCLDESNNPDPACNCLARNNCSDQRFMSSLAGFNLGQDFERNVATPYSLLSRGNLTGAKTNPGILKQAAHARRLLQELKDKVGDQTDLNKNQLAQANSLKELGVPPSLARSISALPVTSKTLSLKSKLMKAGAFKSNKNYANNNSSKSLFFNNKKTGKNVSKKSNSLDFLKRFGQKKKKSRKVSSADLNYAKKATRKAQINRNNSSSIFKIISRRYQVTGQRNLEIIH